RTVDYLLSFSSLIHVRCRLPDVHSLPTRRSSDLRPIALDLPSCGLPTKTPKRSSRADRRPGSCAAMRGAAAWSTMDTPEPAPAADRKSTRLNSSHVKISYAVFCLKKKMSFEQY